LNLTDLLYEYIVSPEKSACKRLYSILTDGINGVFAPFLPQKPVFSAGFPGGWTHLIVKKSGARWTVKLNNATAFDSDIQSGGIGVISIGHQDVDYDEIALFDRATTDTEDEALSKARPAKKAVPYDDRYLGATAEPDPTNTGWINGNKMNPGNYVIYNGTQTAGIWEYSYMYRWDGLKWEKLLKAKDGTTENAWRYMDGVCDLTHGAPLGVFSEAFVGTLMAEQAFIAQLGAQEITIRNDGVKSGMIKSQGYEPDMQGFMINANGDAEFNNGVFRGHVNMETGTIEKLVTLKGMIDSNVLKLLPSSTLLYSPAIGTIALTLMNQILADLEIGLPGSGSKTLDLFPKTGTFFYSGQSRNIIKIQIWITYSGPLALMIHYDGGSYGYYAGDNINNSLSFTLGSTDLQLRLENLPIMPVVSNEVYRVPSPYNAGDYLLSVKG